MRCNSDCKFLCAIKQKGKIKTFCSRTGWDLKDLPEKVLDDCPKFIDKAYVRHDILSGKY